MAPASRGSFTKAGTSPLTLTGAEQSHRQHDGQCWHAILVWKWIIRQFAGHHGQWGAILNVAGVTSGANFNTSPAGFALASAQTLQGTGTVVGNTIIFPSGATVAPATSGSVGILTVTGNTALDGILSEDVSGSNADKLSITGNMDLFGGTLNLPATNTYDPTGTTVYTVLTYTGTRTNQFAAVKLNGNNPANYQVDYSQTARSDWSPSQSRSRVRSCWRVRLQSPRAIGVGEGRWQRSLAEHEPRKVVAGDGAAATSWAPTGNGTSANRFQISKKKGNRSRLSQ